MHLSRRMHMVADMVPQSACVADVGCDHGYLSIWLIREGIAKRAIAMDLREGPLARAKENIRFFHQQERVETRLSDGLTELRPGEADTIVIAGMGGELMAGILKQGAEKVRRADCLVLQPQSDVHLVRAQLQEEGFTVVREDACFEDGKYYVVLCARRGTTVATDKCYEAYYGTYLIETSHPVYLEYLRQELGKKETMLSRLRAAGTPLAMERIPGAERERDVLVQALRDSE